MQSEFDRAWREAEVGIRRSLELAHVSLRAAGLPVGAVVIDGSGTVVAEGRNRAFDPPSGDDRLQGTPLAHAEMNALARIATDTDLTTMTMWSTHRPCPMCAAACAFTGVGDVRFVAPDPSEEEVGPDPSDVAARWLVVSYLWFLSAVKEYSGPSAPMILRASGREPEITDLLLSIEPARLRAATVRESLAPIWTQVTATAERRHRRHP